MMLSRFTLLSVATVLPVYGFVGAPAFHRPSTRVYLEDWVADMIDGELHRQQHKKEYETAWMEKNRAAVVSRLTETTNAALMDDEQVDNYRQLRKDRALADKDPQHYCADRCIATGHCDVYEDIFDFSPEEVVQFCTDCVLVDDLDPDHEECDIPEAFYDFTDEQLAKLKP